MATNGRLPRRLRRILLLLPYAIHHPGVSIDELSRKFGVRKRDLIDDLNLIFMCGLPGYGPGDLIDVSVDGDKVYVRMADYFSAPLRLTSAEALALYAGAATLLELPGMEEADALRRALTKLGRALGVGVDGAQSEAKGVDVKLEGGPDEHLEAIRNALTTGKRVDMEYFSAHRGELTERTVDPWGLVGALGRWYLVGWDHSAEDERMFRLDRIKKVTVTADDAEVPADFDPDRYRSAFLDKGEGQTLSFEISPGAAAWFEDYYPVRASDELKDGWKRIEMTSSGQRWAAVLLLQLGADVRNIKPDTAVNAARTLAKEIAARY
jgi:proteasome accessory factor C